MDRPQRLALQRAFPTPGPAAGAEEHLRLADGRRIAFSQYGAADGHPAFFFHGWPGSRLDFVANAAAATAAGVRVIAVDRPGIGGSDPQPGRAALDWPREVGALADSLGLDQFAVFGFSFGGPYARACAYALPDRVTRAGLVSCLGPIDDPAAKRGCRRPPGTGWLPRGSRHGSPGRWSGSRPARPVAAR